MLYGIEFPQKADATTKVDMEYAYETARKYEDDVINGIHLSQRPRP